ncbi:hypothetical protein CNR22_16795 [Sphingobacteriaceae bacterium]|nr:hypothetical protein CNR22_16795 [Sphingobacteriaceae bacterium]
MTKPSGLIYALAVGILMMLYACKKGENDPAVSLLTRKARLTGEWKMTSGKAIYTQYTSKALYTFDGNSYTATIIESNKSKNTSGDYSVRLTIRRDGDFKAKEIYGPTMLDCEGIWAFNTGVGKQKAKEATAFSITKVNEGLITSCFFNRISPAFIYTLKELRNNKLVLTSSGRILSDTKGNYASLTTEYTFEK